MNCKYLIKLNITDKSIQLNFINIKNLFIILKYD